MHDKFDFLNRCGWKFGASNTVGMYHDFEFVKVLLHLQNLMALVHAGHLLLIIAFCCMLMMAEYKDSIPLHRA